MEQQFLNCSLGRVYKKEVVCIEIYGLERTPRKSIISRRKPGKGEVLMKELKKILFPIDLCVDFQAR